MDFKECVQGRRSIRKYRNVIVSDELIEKIVQIATYSPSWKNSGIATQTLCLAAHEEGLGTVIMGIYNEDIVIDVAEIPEGQKVSAIVAIGYADESPAIPKRKNANEILCFLK